MLPRKAGKARLLLLRMVWMGAVFCAGAAVCAGQSAAAPHGGSSAPPGAASATPAVTPQFHSGLTEIGENWLEHDGDNPAWAARDLNESGWTAVDDIEDMGAAKAGWKWFRKRVVMGPDHSDVRLLISGGGGVYEIYVNGKRMEGAALEPALAVTRPKEQVFALADDGGDYQIALRTHAPPAYTLYRLPLFLDVTLGDEVPIGYERQALESERLYEATTTIAINFLVFLGGLGALALFVNQPTQRDYLWLGVYLSLLGLSNGIWITQQAGVLPESANLLFADPLTYLFNIAQIEFTFSFAGKRVYRWMRWYELILLLPVGLPVLGFAGHFDVSWYVLIEAIVQMPVAVLMPVFLLTWYLRGNREAKLLILPSLLPSAVGSLYDVGTFSIFLGWGRLDFLDNPILLGPVPVHSADLAGLLFLFAIAIVMFFRFTRVSREQARTAAELEAAREIQRRLVPASLPSPPGLHLEAAYLPAQEVGGDFYQVLELGDGSTLIALGDVSGKGLKAAMTGTLAIGALRALGAETLGPGELLERLNRQMVQAQDGGFVTCIAARIAANGELAVANAGHLSPYWNGREIACEPGLPLGILAGAEYAETAVRAGAGDRITFLSDGVVEARNSTGELLGFERTRALSLRAAADIAAEAQRFGQEDDITVLTLEFAPVSSLIAAARL